MSKSLFHVCFVSMSFYVEITVYDYCWDVSLQFGDKFGFR
jgi:hypothetical protein